MPRARRADRGGGAPISTWALVRGNGHPGSHPSGSGAPERRNFPPPNTQCPLVRLEKRKAACRASACAVSLIWQSLLSRFVSAGCDSAPCSTRNHDPKQTLANGVVNDSFAPHIGRRGKGRFDPEADIEMTALKVVVAPAMRRVLKRSWPTLGRYNPSTSRVILAIDHGRGP